MEKIETARMIGERVNETHLVHLNRMHSHPQVMETLGGLLSEEATQHKLNEWIKHWTDHGFGLWVFFSKETHEFVGRGGIRHCSIEGKTEVELAYAVMPAFWNQGYATELGQVSVTKAFEEFKLPDLVCFTLIENAGSVAVMKKLGYKYEKKILRGCRPHVFYRLLP